MNIRKLNLSLDAYILGLMIINTFLLLGISGCGEEAAETTTEETVTVQESTVSETSSTVVTSPVYPETTLETQIAPDSETTTNKEQSETNSQGE